MVKLPEGGLRNTRIHFVRETERGVTPTNPAWLLFSDVVKSFDWPPAPTIAQLRGLGAVDPRFFSGGTETHSLTIEYLPQRWFVDGAGAALDAAGDGMLRGPDNELPATHSVLIRQHTVRGGADGGGRRIYTYAEGATIGTVALAGEPGSGEPVQITLSYQAQLIRSYLIDQPAEAGTLTVESTSEADTTQKLTIESDGAEVSEAVQLTGTTPVSTIASFSSIDAIRLDQETIGDVIVKRGATVLAVIRGQNSYQGRAGDLGLPLLGSGSFEEPLKLPFIHFLGSRIERPDTVPLDDEIMSVSLSVENNITTRPRVNARGPSTFEGVRDVTVTANVFGERSSHDTIMQSLQVEEHALIWELSAGLLTLPDSIVSAPGNRAPTQGEAVMERGVTFTGKGLVVEAADASS